MLAPQTFELLFLDSKELIARLDAQHEVSLQLRLRSRQVLHILGDLVVVDNESVSLMLRHSTPQHHDHLLLRMDNFNEVFNVHSFDLLMGILGKESRRLSANLLNSLISRCVDHHHFLEFELVFYDLEIGSRMLKLLINVEQVLHLFLFAVTLKFLSYPFIHHVFIDIGAHTAVTAVDGRCSSGVITWCSL